MIFKVLITKSFRFSDLTAVKISKMATEGLKVETHQESLDALTREAEQLKSKLEEERAKLVDTDCTSLCQTLYLTPL